MDSDLSPLPGVEPVPNVPEIARTDSRPPRPWGFWATLGLTATNLLVVVSVGLGLDKFVAVVGMLIPSVIPAGLRADGGFVLALITVVGAPVAVGCAWFCASRRPGIRAEDCGHPDPP
jgi:hypothetical protein